MVRAKFKLNTKLERAGTTNVEMTFSAVCLEDKDNVEENRRYHKYSPNGELKITVDNPSVTSKFLLGEYYYLDFIPVKVQ